MWTFTISSQVLIDLSPEKKMKICSEIWRRFTSRVRRSKLLSNHERNFQYVKVTELQQNGSPHFHCVFDRYIRRHIINSLWEKTILEIFDYNHKPGNAYVKGSFTSRKASHYVAKYLLKTIKEMKGNSKFRIWSKSNKSGIFPKKPFYSPWRYFNNRSGFLYLSILRATSHEKSQIIKQSYFTAEKEMVYIGNST